MVRASFYSLDSLIIL